MGGLEGHFCLVSHVQGLCPFCSSDNLGSPEKGWPPWRGARPPARALRSAPARCGPGEPGQEKHDSGVFSHEGRTHIISTVRCGCTVPPSPGPSLVRAAHVRGIGDGRPSATKVFGSGRQLHRPSRCSDACQAQPGAMHPTWTCLFICSSRASACQAHKGRHSSAPLRTCCTLACSPATCASSLRLNLDPDIDPTLPS